MPDGIKNAQYNEAAVITIYRVTDQNGLVYCKV